MPEFGIFLQILDGKFLILHILYCVVLFFHDKGAWSAVHYPVLKSSNIEIISVSGAGDWYVIYSYYEIISVSGAGDWYVIYSYEIISVSGAGDWYVIYCFYNYNFLQIELFSWLFLSCFWQQDVWK